MIPGVTKRVARVEPRWEDGIFLGVSDWSDELYVDTERDTHKVRTVRRREATERVDLTFLNSEFCVNETLGRIQECERRASGVA